jgi:hypothetical protein
MPLNYVNLQTITMYVVGQEYNYKYGRTELQFHSSVIKYVESLTFFYPEFSLIEYDTFNNQSHGTSLN